MQWNTEGQRLITKTIYSRQPFGNRIILFHSAVGDFKRLAKAKIKALKSQAYRVQKPSI